MKEELNGQAEDPNKARSLAFFCGTPLKLPPPAPMDGKTGENPGQDPLSPPKTPQLLAAPVPCFSTLAAERINVSVYGEDYRFTPQLPLLPEATALGKTALVLVLDGAIESICVLNSPVEFRLHIPRLQLLSGWSVGGVLAARDVDVLAREAINCGVLNNVLPADVNAVTVNASRVSELALLFDGRLDPGSLERLAIHVKSWNMFHWDCERQIGGLAFL